MADLGGYMGPVPEGQDRWDAPSLVATQYSVGAVVLSIATIVYALRIYTRILITKMAPRWDDYLAGAAMVSTWVFYACTVGMIKNGGCGKNMWQTTVEEYTELLKWTLPVNIFYMLSADLAKLSLLVLYLQLSPDRTFRITVKALIAVFVLYATIYALVSIFGCSPIYAHWDLVAQQTATCIDKFSFFLAASVANVCMDIIILLVPLRIVIPLQISRRQKVSLLSLFATGGFVIVIASYACVLTVNLFSSDNYTHGLSNELSWMYAELALSVICASASTLKPFFTRHLPALFGSAFNTSRPSGPRSGGMELSHGLETIGGGSKAQKLTRKQMSQHGIELGSDNESDPNVNGGRDAPSSRGVDDDEANLWPRRQCYRRQDTNDELAVTPAEKSGRNVALASSGGPNKSEWPMPSDMEAQGPMSPGLNGANNPGINVTKEVSISYHGEEEGGPRSRR